jgi:hypothetical protein
MEMYYLAASGQPVASLSTIKGDLYQSFVGVHANAPYNEIDFYSRGGQYVFKRSLNAGEEALMYFSDYTTGEYFARITRQGVNDYRLAILQGGAWVTK